MSAIIDEQARKKLLALIEERAAAVADIEARAKTIIEERQDQAGYGVLMRQKAGLLAGLAGDARPFAAGAAEAEVRALERFSTSVNLSLQFDSVFFMSALLYPEEHKPGEPNDLDALLAAMKSKT